jgi:hypothetical protein
VGEWVSLKASSFANSMILMPSLQVMGGSRDASKWLSSCVVFFGLFDQPFMLELFKASHFFK